MPRDKTQVTTIDAGASADIGAADDTAVTNPASSASVIAALKGIIKQLQGDGSGAADVDVSDRAARDLGKVDIAGIDAIGAIAGQKAMAASVPIVVASDQSNVPVSQATHDNLNLNANIQVANADAANGNPVPVSDAGGALSIDIGGVAPGLDNTNEIKASIYGKNVAAGDTPVLVDASGNVLVSLATTLSSATDSIDVAKMSKGSVTTAHSAITATTTSAEIDCRGHKDILVECAVSAISVGNWVITVLGCMVSGGTFGYCYRQISSWEKMETPALTVIDVRTFKFEGVSNYVKILATRTTDGTLTCKVMPIN